MTRLGKPEEEKSRQTKFSQGGKPSLGMREEEKSDGGNPGQL